MTQRPCKDWVGDSWRSARNIRLSSVCALAMSALKPVGT